MKDTNIPIMARINFINIDIETLNRRSKHFENHIEKFLKYKNERFLTNILFAYSQHLIIVPFQKFAKL
jgi:hypothetical protein